MRRTSFVILLAALIGVLGFVTFYLVWNHGAVWGFILLPAAILLIGILAHLQGVAELEEPA